MKTKMLLVQQRDATSKPTEGVMKMATRKTPQKVTKEVKWAGGNSIGTKVPEGWYTRHDAAKLIGRHPDTLKVWRKIEGSRAVRLHEGRAVEGVPLQRGRHRDWQGSGEGTGRLMALTKKQIEARKKADILPKPKKSLKTKSPSLNTTRKPDSESGVRPGPGDRQMFEERIKRKTKIGPHTVRVIARSRSALVGRSTPALSTTRCWACTSTPGSLLSDRGASSQVACTTRQPWQRVSPYRSIPR